MDRIGANWTKVKAAFQDAHDSFDKDILMWHRFNDGNIPGFFEQPSGTFIHIPLKVLMIYNTFRTWPILVKELGGEVDDENCVAQLYNPYLQSLGYWVNDKFDFRLDKDYFSIGGKDYKCEGDTNVSQVDGKPIHTYLILRVEETTIGDVGYKA